MSDASSSPTGPAACPSQFTNASVVDSVDSIELPIDDLLSVSKSFPPQIPPPSPREDNPPAGGRIHSVIHLPALSKAWLIAILEKLQSEGHINRDWPIPSRSDLCDVFHSQPQDSVDFHFMPFPCFHTEAHFNFQNQRWESIKGILSLSEWMGTEFSDLDLPCSLDDYFGASDDATTELLKKDQVIYRHYASSPLFRNSKFHRILMVSRFWVCKVDGYLITALWQPMNDDGLLISPTYEFIDCVEKLRPWAGFHDILERLLPQLVGRTNLAFPNLDDPIHTIFKEAIAQQYGQQLSRHREFRDPLKSDEERRDLISNEIESFRVIMDIIHELSLIINIIEEQQDFTFAQAKRLNFSFGTLSEVGSFREQVVSSMGRFKALRDRAGIAKSSTESLLDIKMKQENLEQATNIRKLTGNISSLVAEADQRARESERAQTMLFVFTIVTVIFTPLSFVAAFFAIPSREFPQEGEGISWSKAQIGWGLGISEVATLIVVLMLSCSLMTSSNMFSWISWQRLRGGRQGDAERNLVED